MQMPQIDYMPAVIMLGIGCVIAVVLRWFEARDNRISSEATREFLKQLDEANSSPQE